MLLEPACSLGVVLPHGKESDMPQHQEAGKKSENRGQTALFAPDSCVFFKRLRGAKKMSGPGFPIFSQLPTRGAGQARRSVKGDISCWKAPNAQCILAEKQFPVLGTVEIQVSIDEFQLLVHRQLPTRVRIAGPPDQLLAPELLVDGFEERVRVLVGKLFRERQFVRLGGADPDLWEALQPEHFPEFG